MALKDAEDALGVGKLATEFRYALFVEAYIANKMNATKAATEAGYSLDSAEIKGSQLLQHPRVQVLLKARLDGLLKKHELTSDKVLKSLAQALLFDPRTLVNVDGKLKPLHELDDDAAMALAKLKAKTVDDGEAKLTEVSWEPKTGVREQALKFLGLFAKDNEQKKTALDELERGDLNTLKELLVDIAHERTAARVAAGEPARVTH